MWCSEQQIEWIAKDLGLDPIEMRRKNSHHEGYVVPGQATIASCGIDQCYDEIKTWIKSKGKLPKNRSIGISACGFMSGGIFNWFDTPTPSPLRLSLSITTELLNSMWVHRISVRVPIPPWRLFCAEALGVKVEDIKVHSGDTDHCPADLGAWGSRQTLMTGNAVKMAAEDAKKQLLEFAYAQSGLNIVYDLDIKEGWYTPLPARKEGKTSMHW